MVLLLLIILAVLIWLIQRELEAGGRAEDSLQVACHACRKTVDSDLIVCPYCQQQLRRTCPHCHRSKLIGHPFCPSCGQPEGEVHR